MSTEITLLNNEKNYTENEIKVFESQYLTTMKGLSDAIKAKKKFEEDEKKFKEKLGKIMDENGIKSIDNQYVKIIRVAGTKDSVTIDLKEFEKQEPETYAEILRDYPKTVKGKAESIRFNVK